ncbi:MAG: MazG nucleotide pyrophosphohydrolase domain-containing protein [Dehalococcoidia bacterium]|jgi:tetrapyrrole methylase family protein/MazG family protein|nr:MazG nucleotide pyrophosphohydrolase domain-containing protein [Dehalococcoidia bacterium]
MSRDFKELIKVVETLRGTDGCPWDKEQTHLSLKPLLIEEVYELVSAIEDNNQEKIIEELGDILIHIVFHADIGKNQKTFSFNEIFKTAITKLKRRHPHIFSSEKSNLNLDEVHKQWDRIKQEENNDPLSLIKNIPNQLPSLLKSASLYSRGKKLNLIKKQKIPTAITFDLKPIEQMSKKETSKKIFELVASLEEIGLNTEDILREYNNSVIKKFISNKD